MRTYCLSLDSDTISWLGALRDPQLAAAMNAMHNDLAYPWTVDALAYEAGMSRSAFAAAFRAKAGDTPLAYLTERRMYRAKSLLRDTPLSLQEIAVRVGYDSGAVFSRVFTRREGAAPGAWRRSRFISVQDGSAGPQLCSAGNTSELARPLRSARNRGVERE
jgi:transcriptional regulator GlxA family with amidase domain